MTVILDNCRSPSAGLSGSKPLPIAVSFLELALGEGKAAKRIIATVHDGTIGIAKGRHLVLNRVATIYSAGKRGQLFDLIRYLLSL